MVIQTDRQTDILIHVLIDGLTDRYIDTWKVRQTDILIIHGWIEGQTDRHIDTWMVRQTDIQTL